MMLYTNLLLAFALLLQVRFSDTELQRMLYEGGREYAAGKYEAALIHYDAVLTQEPENYMALEGRGAALYRLGKHAAAAEAWASATYVAPDKATRAKSYFNLGNSYMKRKAWEQAIKHFSSALKNNPEDALAKYNLSYALAMRDKEKEERKSAKQGMKKDDREPKAGDTPKPGGQQTPADNKGAAPNEQLNEGEAEQLLNALNEQENEIRRRRARRPENPPGPPARSGKPW